MPSLFTESKNANEQRFADVILPLNIAGVLTYGVPLEMQGALQPGMRVEVPLGANKFYSGVVSRIHDEAPERYEVKSVRAIMDEAPVVNEVQLRFWQWIASYYIAAPGEVLNAALPAHLKLSGETRLQWAPKDEAGLPHWSDQTYLAAEALQMRKAISIADLRSIVGARHLTAVINELVEAEAVLINDALEPVYKPRREKIVSLAESYKDHAALSALFDVLSRAPKQLYLLQAYIGLAAKDPLVRQTDLLQESGVGASVLAALVAKNIFAAEIRDVDRITFSKSTVPQAVNLTSAQEDAYFAMDEGLSAKGTVLLQGVTGSGKTLLYIKKIREVLASGKQALFLLPEIGLTTQLVRRLYNFFGEELGVYHSRFSNNERVEIWEKVRSGHYKVVLGPRSALWLPFNNLGLIIADEEHDPSYKQRDPSPRFHARDAAVYLAGLHGAGIVLGSATPSVESLHNVDTGKYAYAGLKERYLGVRLPAIEIINAKSIDLVKKHGFSILTPELQKAMAEALGAGRQIILFQNRRGYAPFQICTVCGWVPQCRNCAVSMTYHKAADRLQCHYCGRVEAPVLNCPSCGSNRLVSPSYGTEKIEEEVKSAFPTARTARMDLDSMRGRNSLSELLDRMDRREVDILVGTQMVVKGLDFAPVSLVSILNADGLLSFPDFRVAERAFQLMEQVAGRAGRADGEGRVLIQAYNLQHPVLQWVSDHDVAAFYRHEIGYREIFGYPPFVRLIKVIIRHQDEGKVQKVANALGEALRGYGSGIVIQGPVPGLVARVRAQWVYEIVIKSPRDRAILEHLKEWLKGQRALVLGIRGMRDVQVVFDVDPG